jgi:hypothetical protein
MNAYQFFDLEPTHLAISPIASKITDFSPEFKKAS